MESLQVWNTPLPKCGEEKCRACTFDRVMQAVESELVFKLGMRGFMSIDTCNVDLQCFHTHCCRADVTEAFSDR